jgi:uncharacterized membrane protein SirB2
MDYLLLKQTHMVLAVISVTGFALRWGWRNAASPLAQHRLVRILPHVVDTLFLLTGVVLAVTIAQAPWSAAWLGAKIGGLVVYVLLGVAAMRMPSSSGRLAFFVLALASFAWIVSVARSKSALGFLQPLFA